VRRQLTEIAGEVLGLRVEINEQEIGPGLQPHRDQSMVLHLEADGVFHAAGADQSAVESERPMMVGTDDSLAVASSGEQLRAPVPAGIGEGLNFALFVAGQQDGDARYIGCHIIAGIG